MAPRVRRALAATALMALLPSGLRAQSTPAPPPDDSQQPVVIEHGLETDAYDANGTLTRDYEARVRVQSAAGLARAGRITFPYSRNLDTLDIRYVRVRKPNGVVVETPVTSAIDVPADATREAPTYSDVYDKDVNVQGLEIGDTLEYAIHERAQSLIPGQFWMEQDWESDTIALDRELRVSVPAGRHVTVKSVDPQPVVTTTGDQHTYTWRNPVLTLPSLKAMAAQAYARRDRRADIQVTSFQNWNEVGDAIRTLWRERTAVTPAIADKARELTTTASSDREKLDAIYTYVATRIRYVAINLGIGRYQPHAAAEVLTNGFGDCKDKHTLLAALLAAVGIDTQAVLIEPGDPLDRDVPSPGQFDHVITFAPAVNGGTWMDATLETAPPGLLVSTERGQGVLRIPAAGEAAIADTPADPFRPDTWTVDVAGAIDDTGTLTASVTETSTGDDEVAMRQAFRLTPPAQWPDLLARISIRQRFGGTVSDIGTSPPEDTSGPFRVTYRYTREAFSKWDSQQVSAALPWLALPGAPGDDTVAVRLAAGERLRATSRIELPLGYDIAFASGTLADTTLTTPFVDYHLENTLNGRVFTTDRDLTQKTKDVAADQFPAYREFLKTLGNEPYVVTLSAIRPWAWGDTAKIDWYGGASASAASTMGTAVAASSRGDHQTAISMLQELTAAEPANAAAGVLLGWAQMQSGATEAGIRTIRDQMTKTPTASGYKMLAMRLATAGRRDEAIETWQRGRQLFPDDREMPLYLAEALIGATRYRDAIAILTSRAAAETGSARLAWNLGRAYAGAGQTTDAVAAFSQAAAADGSPSSLNAIAWQMAVDRIGLDVAEGFASRAVHAAEADAARVTLSTLDASSLRLMSSLAAYWDTLAWIDFRRGDTAAALRHMTPAWDLGQLGLLAEHLAEMYEARGDSAQAAAYYARALAVDQPEASAAARLLALVPDQADRAAIVSAVPAAVAAERTTTVPRLPNISGHADVFVIVGAHGAVNDVRFVTGDPAMHAAAEMLRAATIPSRLPADDSPAVVRRGTLVCAADAPACTFTLLPAGRVGRVN